MAGLTIEQLGLNPVAKAAAQTLLRTHPSVNFTSGRRDLEAQAHAMASNIVASGRDWIRKVYLHAAALQTWVDTHPEAVTVEQLADGLHSVLLDLSTTDLSHLSRHLTGDAFDVQPAVDNEDLPTVEGSAIVSTILHLPGLERFLDHEGGLCRWHCQFAPSAEV